MYKNQIFLQKRARRNLFVEALRHNRKTDFLEFVIHKKRPEKMNIR